jgi:hypothetical protein
LTEFRNVAAAEFALPVFFGAIHPLNAMIAQESPSGVYKQVTPQL